MNDRERLLEALLAGPQDHTLLLVLADWHDDNALPHQAALLRLAHALRLVPYPAEPDEECHKFFVEKRWREASRCDARFLAVRQRSVAMTFAYGSGCGREWPDCMGWHGAGRLPGVAAAYRHLHGHDAAAPRIAARRRLLAACELYCCGVISAGERDREFMTQGHFLHAILGIAGVRADPNETAGSFAHAAWRLRGGRAGNAVGMMQWLESYACWRAWEKLRPPGVPAWKRRADALALARTYHRELLRVFAAGEPWLHGVGVYAARKSRKAGAR